MRKTAQRDLILRLRSIEGHLRGVERMVLCDEPCPAVLHQVLAIRRALDRVSEGLVEEHVSECLHLAESPSDRETFERAVRGLAAVYAAKRAG